MKASEIEGVLTLDQLKQMDGQRVLVPETEDEIGGFCIVDAENCCVFRLYTDEELLFPDYLKHWIALPDPYGIVEVGGETDV